MFCTGGNLHFQYAKTPSQAAGHSYSRDDNEQTLQIENIFTWEWKQFSPIKIWEKKGGRHSYFWESAAGLLVERIPSWRLRSEIFCLFLWCCCLWFLLSVDIEDKGDFTLLFIGIDSWSKPKLLLKPHDPLLWPLNKARSYPMSSETIQTFSGLLFFMVLYN